MIPCTARIDLTKPTRSERRKLPPPLETEFIVNFYVCPQCGAERNCKQFWKADEQPPSPQCGAIQENFSSRKK